MSKITIELDAMEAMMILAPIQDRALTAQANAARWTGPEQEVASIAAAVFGRVAARLADALYPDTCRVMDNEDCPSPIERDGLCAFHYRRLEAQRARLAVTA